MLLVGLLLAPAQADDGAGVTFSRLVVRDGSGDFLGTANVGVRILEHLRDRGVDARGREDLVFGTDHSKSARFALGGTVEQLDGHHGPAEAEAELTILWELLDRVSGEVVYESRVRCYARTSQEQSEVELLALDDCVDQLAGRSRFSTVLDAPPAPELGADDVPAPDWAGPVLVALCEEAPERVLPAAMPEVMPAVVVVQAGDATGTGVTISPDGFVLTAAHVVQDVDVGADGVEVRTESGLTLPAKVVRRDAYQDIAVLHMPGSGYACAPIGPLPTLGADLFAVGNPMGKGLEFSLSRGIVSGHRTWAGVRFVQTDASINPGFSGGPMLDGQGRVVGILSWKLQGDGLEGLGFGVPVDAAFERLGLEEAETSSTDPVALGGVVEEAEVAELAKVTDHDTLAPSRLGVVREAQRVDQRKTIATVGWVTAAVGGGLVVGSWAIAQQDAMRIEDWQATQAFNTLGWVTVVSGAGLGIGATIDW